MSYEVKYRWPVLGGHREDAYIVDTDDLVTARTVAAKAFAEDHPEVATSEVSVRRCRVDGQPWRC